MKQKTAFTLTALALIGLAVLFFSGDKTNTMDDSRTIDPLMPVARITHAHGLAVDVADPTAIYIATHHGLLVLKNDKDLYQVGNTKYDFMGFTVHPTNAKLFYSSGHPPTGGNLGIQKSMDGGLRWEKISDGGQAPVDFHAMTMSIAEPTVLYGWGGGGLHRSNDSGVTWKMVNSSEQFNQLTTDLVDPLTVYATSPSGKGILVSHDQGVTWEILSESLVGGRVITLAISPHNPRAMLTSAEKLGGLGGSQDGGKTWTQIPERFGGETITFIAYDKNTHGTVYALTHTNRIFKSLDDGSTWAFIR